MGRFLLVAVNDEESTCAVCGRVELKRVMWIRDAASGEEPFAVGTTCGAKLLGIPTAKVNTTVKNYAMLVERVRYGFYISHPSWLAARIELEKCTGLTYAQRKLTPEFAEYHRLDKEAHDWAYAQKVEIEL